jgi:hypothetical protein
LRPFRLEPELCYIGDVAEQQKRKVQAAGEGTPVDELSDHMASGLMNWSGIMPEY